MQPADHEHPPGPGGPQAPRLQEGKGEAGRESSSTLYIKGGWESPSRGAVLEGSVDDFQTTSEAPCVHTCARGLSARVLLLCDGPRSAAAKQLGTVPQQTPESLQGPVCPLVYPVRCSSRPWWAPKASLQTSRKSASHGTPKRPGPCQQPLRDVTCSLLGLQQRPQARGWLCPPTLQKPAASEQSPEPPKCLSGFANFVL